MGVRPRVFVHCRVSQAQDSVWFTGHLHTGDAAEPEPDPNPSHAHNRMGLGLLVTDLEGHGSLKRGGLWLWVLFPSTGTFLGPDIGDTLVYGKEASVPNRGHILLSAPALT